MVGSKQLAMDKIREFLAEDIGYGDITSTALIPEGQMARARLYYREPGVASGLEEAALIFEVLGCTVSIAPDRKVALGQPAQTVIFVVQGRAAVGIGRVSAWARSARPSRG